MFKKLLPLYMMVWVDHGEANVQSDQVAQRKRAHGMIGAQHHGLIDVLSRGDMAFQNSDRLVDGRDQDSIDNKSRRFLNFNRGFIELFRKRQNLDLRFMRSLHAHSQSVEAFGESEPVATIEGQRKYTLELTRLYATEDAVTDGIN